MDKSDNNDFKSAPSKTVTAVYNGLCHTAKGLNTANLHGLWPEPIKKDLLTRSFYPNFRPALWPPLWVWAQPPENFRRLLPSTV